MSALDDLVQTLQAAVSSLESTQSDVSSAEGAAKDAVQAAGFLGRESDMAETEALRSGIEEQAGALANVKQELDDLLQRAAVLQGGGT